MKILDFLDREAISTDLRSKDKKGVIKELVDLLAQAGRVRNKNKIVRILLERESLGSTGIGQGIAIPHGKSPDIKEMTAALGISKRGVNFDALDGEPVYIFFLLLAPVNSAGPHLKALARISRLLKDKYFRDSLRNTTDKQTVIEIIKREDDMGG